MSTSAAGAFGWDVVAGSYKVRAHRAGCGGAESAVLTIPPPVTDLVLTINCEGIPVTSVGPAKVWVGVRNSDDVGTRVDLLAEVFADTSKIAEGRLTNVATGSSGFNNANRPGRDR
jgi:hypothetical protein